MFDFHYLFLLTLNIVPPPQKRRGGGIYCGDGDQWFFPAYALRDTEIHEGDRICQFRIMEHQPKIVFEETEKLDNKDRGGIGSTGKN